MPGRLEVREIRCKSLLHRLGAGARSGEYTINLYRGCTHGCVYCYAPSLVHDQRKWGSFVDAKVNAPEVLRRELREAPKSPVFLSSASDPYQPLEARYQLTRRCLEELSRFAFPVVILTRSPLVLRDTRLLKGMEWARVGCSISTASGRGYEPGVPPLERRLETLRALSSEGLETWVSLAPVVPGVANVEVKRLLARLHVVGVKVVTPGLLRLRGYPASKEMFELSTGMSEETALRAAREAIAEVREAVSESGFGDGSEFFDWAAPPCPRLDQYVGPPDAAAAISSSAWPA